MRATARQIVARATFEILVFFVAKTVFVASRPSGVYIRNGLIYVADSESNGVAPSSPSFPILAR